MDFHSLTRKELQTLCKKNKIPANITNVAMADALKALETVEGLEEIINQSPEKTMNKSSQEIPSSLTRTSTRRKTTKEEPQSTQPTTRTRRTTRKTVELEEENKNVNVRDTPVMATTTARRRAQKTEPQVEEQKKSELLETPALQSGRRRAAVGSTRRKVGAQKAEGSVQQTYGSRRSVRLLEKCMEGLSLKEGGRMEPVKIDEMVGDVVEEKNAKGQSEAASEVPVARNLSVSLEDVNDLKDDDMETTKSHHVGENDCIVTSDAGAERSDNFDNLSLALDTKDASPKEETHRSDAYLAKSETELAYMFEGTVDPKGSDDVVSEDYTEIESSKVKEESVALENNGGSYANETESIEALVAEASESENKPEEVLDHASFAEDVNAEEYANYSIQEIECQKSVGTEHDINVVMQVDHASDDQTEEYGEGNVSQNVSDLQNSSKEEAEVVSNIVDASGDSDIDDDSNSNKNSLADDEKEEVPCETDSYGSEDLAKPAEAEECDEGNVSQSVSDPHKVFIDSSKEEAEDVSNIVNACGDSDIDDDSSSDNSSSTDEEEEVPSETDSYGSEDSMTNIVNASGDLDIDDSSDNSSSADEEGEVPSETDSFGSEDLMTSIMNEDALIDVKVAEAGTVPLVENTSHNAPQSIARDISVNKILDDGDAEALVDICIKPAKEFPESTLEIPQEKSPIAAKLMDPFPCVSSVSNSEITSSKPFSPALTAQFSQTTRFTPWKSSSKKQATVPKVALVSDINKENIDNSDEKEVEPTLAKVKKNKDVIDKETMQNLDDYSLRQLRKLTKKFDKLEMAENMKNKEVKYDSKEQGKTRPALQILPQNCVHGGETEEH